MAYPDKRAVAVIYLGEAPEPVPLARTRRGMAYRARIGAEIVGGKSDLATVLSLTGKPDATDA